MVAMPKKAWLTGMRLRLGAGAAPDRSDSESFGFAAQNRLGILSFEAARTMSRLISLHRVLSEEELSRLRSITMRSDGVAYLNSTDSLFLMRAACAELVDDLDYVTASISRLADRCRLGWPRGFDDVYADAKSGSGEFILGYPSRDLDRKVKKMVRYVSSTSALHDEMEALAELEASERNLQRWRNYSGPMTPVPQRGLPPSAAVQAGDPPGAGLMLKKLAEQRRRVRRLKEESLWGKTYDKVADLMSRTVITLFARVCYVFSMVVTDLPLVVLERDGRFRFAVNRRHHNPHQLYFSGPLERPAAGAAFLRISGPIPRTKAKGQGETKPWTARHLEPPAGSVGEAGLALRYADVVALAEEMLLSPGTAGRDAREELYGMLPSALRKAVKAKLRSSMRGDAGAKWNDDGMADGWRDAAGRILQWLGPMAHDTVRWYSERSCDRQSLEPAGRKVLLLQTLHFADREKAEAAIVEVLVGLSCVYRCQKGVFSVGKEVDEDSGELGYSQLISVSSREFDPCN